MLIIMTDGVTVLFGAVGAVAALLAVLVPVIRAQGAALRREIDTLRIDVGEVRRDLHVLSDRVARIEGMLTGPWRPPANGTPAASAPSFPVLVKPEAEHEE